MNDQLQFSVSRSAIPQRQKDSKWETLIAAFLKLAPDEHIVMPFTTANNRCSIVEAIKSRTKYAVKSRRVNNSLYIWNPL